MKTNTNSKTKYWKIHIPIGGDHWERIVAGENLDSALTGFWEATWDAFKRSNLKIKVSFIYNDELWCQIFYNLDENNELAVPRYRILKILEGDISNIPIRNKLSDEEIADQELNRSVYGNR